MKILENSRRTYLYLSKLPKIYLVGYWYKYGVMEFYFYKLDKNNVPLVYQYNDRNGTADLYELVPITQTTTGDIITWSFNEEVAKRLASDLNKLYEYENNKILFSKEINKGSKELLEAYFEAAALHKDVEPLEKQILKQFEILSIFKRNLFIEENNNGEQNYSFCSKRITITELKKLKEWIKEQEPEPYCKGDCNTCPNK